mgnify:CR=1 FL=1
MRLFKQVIVVTLLTFSVVHMTMAQDDNSTKAITENFVQQLSDGKAREAIISFYDRNNFLETRKAEIEVLIANTETALQRIGLISEFDFVRTEKLTPRLERHIYQMYHERLPVHVSIFIYKVDGEWIISSFKFNTDISIIRPIANSNDQIPEETVIIAEGIMEKLSRKEVDEAFRTGFKNSDENLITDGLIENANRQMNILFSFLGEPVGYSKGSFEQISPRHVKVIYYLDLASHPIPVIFDFYKNLNDIWSVINFTFNDQFNNIEANLP